MLIEFVNFQHSFSVVLSFEFLSGRLPYSNAFGRRRMLSNRVIVVIDVLVIGGDDVVCPLVIRLQESRRERETLSGHVAKIKRNIRPSVVNRTASNPL